MTCEAAVNASRQAGPAPLTLQQQVMQGLVQCIPFPNEPQGKYHCFTPADPGRLREAADAAPHASHAPTCFVVDHVASPKTRPAGAA